MVTKNISSELEVILSKIWISLSTLPILVLSEFS